MFRGCFGKGSKFYKLNGCKSESVDLSLNDAQISNS